MQPVRIAATSSLADEWAFVLTAAGIPNSVEPDAAGWVVLAPAEEIERAQLLPPIVQRFGAGCARRVRPDAFRRYTAEGETSLVG